MATEKPLFEFGSNKESLTCEGIEVYLLCLRDQKQQIERDIARYEEALKIRRQFDDN